MSFSGLKTAVVNEVHNAQQRGEEVRVADMAAQGYYEFKDGNIADLTLNGLPTLAIDYR